MKIKVTKYDIILVVMIIIISLSCIFISFYNSLLQKNTVLKIFVEDKLYKEYILSEELDQIIEVKGKLYVNVIKIENEKISVIESDCPDKICQRHIPISRPGEMIVCLPNRVVIRIEGFDEKQDLDYISE